MPEAEVKVPPVVVHLTWLHSVASDEQVPPAGKAAVKPAVVLVASVKVTSTTLLLVALMVRVEMVCDRDTT